jgi:hypothetical protein
MKLLIYLVAGTLMTGFTDRRANDIDGIWMGYYRSEIIKEKVIVKFNQSDKMEFFTGGVDDRTRSEGSYRIQGDSVLLTYRTPEGEVIVMKGRFNRRKNYVDGTWKGNDRSAGSFYLEKQKVEEFFAAP